MIMDTYKAVERLVNRGIKKEHAVAFTEMFNDQNSDLATKSDVSLLKSELKSDIALLKSELKSDIIEVKNNVALVENNIEHIKEQMATKSDIERVHNNILKWVVGSYIVTGVTIIFSSPIVKIIQQYSL